MITTLIKNTTIVNRGQIFHGDILIKRGRIEKIASSIEAPTAKELDGSKYHALPGIIDDQVHFREPGLTHKAHIASEAKAALSGGVTSFMEMPNTKPPTLTQTLLAEKYQIAANTSLANYSFFMGASNDNLEEVLKTNPKNVCGIKVFMGSSTGNMLVDDPKTLENLFSKVSMLIATHCEDEQTIRRNEELFREKYGAHIPIAFHPAIRNVEGCYLSSSMAVELAQKHNTRLHILHISTKDELDLFANLLPLPEKRITAEVCVHHLYFNQNDYESLGTQIKCNPAIKSQVHQAALLQALLEDKLDIIATDHAPHTWEEKQNSYFLAPSGVPLVQHALNIMLEFYQQGLITLEKIVEKMCHAPALCFRVADRGFLEEGAWADITLVDLKEVWKVEKQNIYYQCAWSPLEGKNLHGRVKSTFVNGHLAYHHGQFNGNQKGQRLLFY